MKTFSCDTEPADTIVVEGDGFAQTYNEVWVRVTQDGITAMVMLKPKKARKLAKAILRAAEAGR